MVVASPLPPPRPALAAPYPPPQCVQPFVARVSAGSGHSCPHPRPRIVSRAELIQLRNGLTFSPYACPCPGQGCTRSSYDCEVPSRLRVLSVHAHHGPIHHAVQAAASQLTCHLRRKPSALQLCVQSCRAPTARARRATQVFIMRLAAGDQPRARRHAHGFQVAHASRRVLGHPSTRPQRRPAGRCAPRPPRGARPPRAPPCRCHSPRGIAPATACTRRERGGGHGTLDWRASPRARGWPCRPALPCARQPLRGRPPSPPHDPPRTPRGGGRPPSVMATAIPRVH